MKTITITLWVVWVVLKCPFFKGYYSERKRDKIKKRLKREEIEERRD